MPIQNKKGDKTTVQKQYSDFIMRAVRQSLGLDEDDTSRDEEIMEMAGAEIVDRYLTWNGIIGYTSYIINVVSQAIFEPYEESYDD